MSNQTLEASRASYDTWHSQLGIDLHADSPWYRLVKRYLPPSSELEGKNILEIGCGRGDFTLWLYNELCGKVQLTGADFSNVAVEMASNFAKKLGANIDWRVEDIQNIGVADNSFDLVISCETIEHVPVPTQAIRELARVLKPGGRLLLTTPSYLGLLGLYRGYLRLCGRKFTEVGQPINNFTMLPRNLVWLRRAGFKIRATDGVGHYLPYPGRPPIELPFFNRFRSITKWLALHSLVVAEKPLR